MGLSVETDPPVPDLASLLDLQALQSLLEEFHRLNSVPLAILDLQGRVLVAVGWQEVCTRFHRVHPETAQNCIESDLFLSGRVKPGEYVAYQCKNGLWDVITPMTVDGVHVGNLFTGQFFYDDQEPDLQFFADQAAACGFDTDTYLQSVARVPRLSRERVGIVMDFLVKLTALLTAEALDARRAIRTAEAHAQAVEDVRQSEANYRALFESVRHGIVFQDADGHVVSANPAAEVILGLTLDQMQGRTSTDPRWRSIHDDGSPFPGETHPAMVALRSGKPVENVTMGVFNPVEGRTTWIDVSAVPLCRPGTDRPHQVCATFLNITTRKMLEDARNYLARAEWLVRGEDFFYALARFLAEHLEMDYVCIDQLEGDALTARTLAVWYDGARQENLSYALKDTPCGDVVGKTVCCFREGVRHLFPKDVALQEMSAESYLGVTLWDSTGHPIGLIALIGREPMADSSSAESTMTLIASRASAELELRQAEAQKRRNDERFRSWFELPLVGICITSPTKGWLEVNLHLCTMLGYTRDELVGMTWAELTLPEDLAADIAQFERVLRGEIEGYSLDKRFVRKDGSVLPTALAVRCVRADDGAVDYFVALLQDISARKRAEEAKATLETALSQAQRMESVGRLAGGVAHDFNNMLGVILGHVEMALAQVDEGQPLHRDLEEVRSAATRSADLTRQLLAFASRQTIAPRPLDLNQSVPGVLAMLNRLIGEHVRLSWQPDARLWLTLADPSQIDQVLTNLCVNARDAITDTGTVTIETGNCAFDREYCAQHPGFVPGEFVRLSVRDDGAGMDPETLAKILEPFFTTKALGRGTGLGLSVVHGVVEQHKGFVIVSSAPASGTTFAVYLPRLDHAVTSLPGNVSAGPLSRGHETILLVEDEPAMLRMTQTILQSQGYIVLAAVAPADALRLARDYAGDIHLLITDVIMPDMNGRELAQRLKSERPAVAQLFMSGYTADVISPHGVLAGDVAFIQKPFSVRDLTAKVREVLG